MESDFAERRIRTSASPTLYSGIRTSSRRVLNDIGRLRQTGMIPGNRLQ
jgi:hypothetical protein